MINNILDVFHIYEIDKIFFDFETNKDKKWHETDVQGKGRKLKRFHWTLSESLESIKNTLSSNRSLSAQSFPACPNIFCFVFHSKIQTHKHNGMKKTFLYIVHYDKTILNFIKRFRKKKIKKKKKNTFKHFK